MLSIFSNYKKDSSHMMLDYILNIVWSLHSSWEAEIVRLKFDWLYSSNLISH